MPRCRCGAVPSWALCAGLVAACGASAAGPGGAGGREVPAEIVGEGNGEPADDMSSEELEELLEKVVWAVNAGGDEVVSSRGVVYSADSATSRLASGGIDAIVPVRVPANAH